MALQRISIALIALSLVGCIAAPTRSDTAEFELKDSGHVMPRDVPLFADCVLDGFQKNHPRMSNTNIQQQRRSNGLRVERYAGPNMLLMSADIFDDGHVELYESSIASLIDTSGERTAFGECLAKYGQKNK